MPAKYIDINLLPKQGTNDYKIGVPGTARVTFGGYRLGNPVGVSSESSVNGPALDTSYIRITQPPVDASVLEPDSASFSIAAEGDPPTLSYQWKKNGVNVGTNSTTYNTGATTWTGVDDTIICVVSNGVASVTSNSATLHVSRSNYGEQSNNLFDGNINYWNGGDSLPSGIYRVTYLRCAWLPTTTVPNSWTVNGIRIWWNNASNNQEAPGVVGYFTSEALAQNASQGMYSDIVHTGGKIGVSLVDNPYADNGGNPCVYLLTRLS
jgi:hypothetical protein